MFIFKKISMKNFTFLIILLNLFATQTIFAQKVVVIGMNHETPDGFSFVATEALSVGEIIYFTDNEYSDLVNAFTFNGLPSGEAVIKFTVTTPFSAGDVVFLNETSTDVFTISGSGGTGTAAVMSGVFGNQGFSLASGGDELYAYSDNDADPTNGIGQIYSVLSTIAGNLPADANPASDYSNSVVVQGFSSLTPNRTEYNPALRNVDVGTVNFTSTANWLNGQTNSNLSTTPFVGVSDPDVSVTVSPSAVLEDGVTNMVYTFTLSTTATSNVTVNFTVGGTATFSTDYTQTGATTFGTSTGTIVIANGTSSSSIAINPSTDAGLETNETVVLTVNSGTGYIIGSPISAAGTITNDDINNTSPLVALTGINHTDPDGFSFAALDNISDGTTIYFTENSFNNSTLSFVGDEAVLKWTASGSVAKGEVIYIKETAPNSLFVICEGGGGCGTITLIGGDFALATTGETFYAYSDNDDNHKNGITTLYSALYTGNSSVPGGNIPALENPVTYYTNSILIDGFPDVNPNRTEYDPLKRVVDVSIANFSNLNNWYHAQTNQDLSTKPFVESIDPSVTVSVSPSAVLEDGEANMVFTFTLSEVATGDYTISFNVEGSAIFNSDYTQTGAAGFSTSSGAVVISNGTSSATVTINPEIDSDVEINETVVLTVSPGAGYVSGSPSSQTGTITNDDTNNSLPLVAITGLNHESPDGFSFVAVNDIPANTKIYFTENSFNNATLTFASGESVVSWASPANIIPAGQVIVVTETGSNIFSLTRSGGSVEVGNITVETGDFAFGTNGETFYAYNDNDNDPTNGITDIYAAIFTGAGSSGGDIPLLEDPSAIYVNALVVDGFSVSLPGRTEYDPAKRNVLVEAVNFKDIANWLNAEANQLLSAVPFENLNVVSSPELTTATIVTFDATSAVLGGDIINGGSNTVTERGVVFSSVDVTPTLGEADVTNEPNGAGTGVFSELVGSLTPNTTYYVQAYATNSVGVSYGGVESFTTSFGIAIWNGSINQDWFTPGNWDGGIVPDADFNVFIPGDLVYYPTLTTPANCNNLIMESKDNSTGSLLGQENLTVGGFAVIERFMAGNQWHMIASPVANQSITSFLTANTNIPTKNVDDRGMMDYNEPSDSWNTFFTTTQIGSLTSGKGYSLRTDGDDIVIFTGTIAGAGVSTSVTSEGNGWNCIGNPFISAISVNAAADAINSFIGINLNEFDQSYAAVYVWEQTNNAYSIINLGDAAFYAQLGQGFFVKTKAGVTEMQFTNAMQTHQPGAVFKSDEISLPEIKLTAKLENHKSSTRIKFDDNMQTKLDVGYDAGIFKTDFDLYSKLIVDNGVNFGIQYLPTSALNKMELSLGLDSKYKGKVEFSSELINIPANCEIVLEDRSNNSFTRLGNGNNYTAAINENSKVNDRFFIHATSSTTGVWEENLKHEYSVYTDNNNIIINGEVRDRAVATLYDLMGRKISVRQLEQAPSNYISTSNLKSGIYLLSIDYFGGSFNQKIPLNK